MNRRRLMMGGNNALEEKRKYFAQMEVGDILLNDLTFVTPNNYTSRVTGVCCVPASATPDGWPRISGIRVLNANGKSTTDLSGIPFIRNTVSAARKTALHGDDDSRFYVYHGARGKIGRSDNNVFYEMEQITEDRTSNIPNVRDYIDSLNLYKNPYYAYRPMPFTLNYSASINEKLFLGFNRFTGSENTDKFIEVLGSYYAVAASACRKYVTTNFQAGDWYLPTFAELVGRFHVDAISQLKYGVEAFTKVKATSLTGDYCHFYGSDINPSNKTPVPYLMNSLGGDLCYWWDTMSLGLLDPNDAYTLQNAVVIPFFDLKKVCERIYG